MEGEYINHINKKKRTCTNTFTLISHLMKSSHCVEEIGLCLQWDVITWFFIVVATTKNEDLNGIRVLFQNRLHIPTLSMHFHEMKMDLSLPKLDLVSLKHTDINGYVLLLPEVNIRGFLKIESRSLFYIINSNRNELDDKMEMPCPKSPEYKY